MAKQAGFSNRNGLAPNSRNGSYFRGHFSVSNRPAVGGNDAGFVATGTHAAPAGEPRPRRLSSQTLTEVRLSSPIELGRTTGATLEPELLLDVFNALNTTADERLADDNPFSQNFGGPSVLVDPPSCNAGLRFSFSQ
jgi:hypothetical protein